MKSTWLYLSAFALLAVLVVAIYAPLTPRYPYPFDSADYMYAGTRGFWVNYVDSGSMPLGDMVEKGIDLVKHPEKRSVFAREIRELKDPAFYRHFHGPMFAYWIALCDAAGVTSEFAVRNSGFVVHILASLAMMLAFWTLFPGWPRLAGLVAGALLLFDRTGLVTAVEITQHLMFMFFTVLTLWSLSLFCRNFEKKWWYTTCVLLGLAFVAVEMAVLLLGTVVVVVAVYYREIAVAWPPVRTRLMLVLKGLGLAILAIFVAWPSGILKLSLLRGFVYLAYMTLERKVFAPYTPLQTWQSHFARAPFQHWMLLAGFVAAVVLWRKFEYKRESLPWIVYAFTYIAVTLKVTQDFTHYRGTISIAWIMATAMVVGYLWGRWKTVGRLALLALVLTGLVGEAVRYRDYMANRDRTSPGTWVVQYARAANLPSGGPLLYVPYVFVPVLHFYLPELRTAGYENWPVSRLVSELSSETAVGQFICDAATCADVARAMGNTTPPPRRLSPPDGPDLYVMETRR